MQLGFIGLGIMGAPMAGHLLAAGHELSVYTHGAVPADIASSKAVVCRNATEVAQRADIVFIMVPDTPDVEAVLFGPRGVAAALQPGAGGARKVVVDMS